MITQPLDFTNNAAIEVWWSQLRPYTSLSFRLMAQSPAVQSRQTFHARKALLEDSQRHIADHPHLPPAEMIRTLLLSALDKYIQGMESAAMDDTERSQILAQTARADLQTLKLLLMQNGIYERLPL